MPDPTQEMRYILGPYNNLLATEGAQNQSFVWGNELLMAEGEKPFCYLNDHLGSPVRLIGGGQDEALAFDEFGVPLVGAQNTRSFSQPFGFTGYQTDDVSGLYFAQARYYEPHTSRMIAEDSYWKFRNPHNSPAPDINAITQSANVYAYCMNNSLRFIDPSGLDVWLIHGTFSDSSTWTDDFKTDVGGIFNQPVHTPDWSGKNSNGARQNAAQDIANSIINQYDRNNPTPIHLAGHSHGGNVAILVSNLLEKEGIRVDTLVTIGTPVREYQLNYITTIGPPGSSPLTNVKQHINVYNRGDGVQVIGGSIWKGGEAGRTFLDAINVEVIPEKMYKRIYNHSFMYA